jgi:hypothetical protein
VTWDLVYAKIYTHSDPGAEPSGGHGRLSPVRVLQVILHTNARQPGRGEGGRNLGCYRVNKYIAII